jgi:hypothetical protein
MWLPRTEEQMTKLKYAGAIILVLVVVALALYLGGWWSL